MNIEALHCELDIRRRPENGLLQKTYLLPTKFEATSEEDAVEKTIAHIRKHYIINDNRTSYMSEPADNGGGKYVILFQTKRKYVDRFIATLQITASVPISEKLHDANEKKRAEFEADESVTVDKEGNVDYHDEDDVCAVCASQFDLMYNNDPETKTYRKMLCPSCYDERLLVDNIKQEWFKKKRELLIPIALDINSIYYDCNRRAQRQVDEYMGQHLIGECTEEKLIEHYKEWYWQNYRAEQNEFESLDEDTHSNYIDQALPIIFDVIDNASHAKRIEFMTALNKEALIKLVHRYCDCDDVATMIFESWQTNALVGKIDNAIASSQ